MYVYLFQDDTTLSTYLEMLSQWLRSKASTCNAGDIGDSGSIPESGRSPGEGNENPLQYSCLGNPMDRRAWGLQFMGLQKVRQDLATKQQQRFNAGRVGFSFLLRAA